MDSTLTKSLRGSIYHIGIAMVTILLGFIRTVLLMRWLADPDPFGVAILAMFFSSLAIPFATFGVDSALIQAKDPPASAFSTNYMLRIILSVGILIIVLVFTPILRNIYPNQVILFIWLLLGLNFIEATYSTHMIVLRREMRFGALAAMNLIASLVMSITAPLLAFFGFGIWSLAAERAAGPLVRWISLWLYLRPWKPSLKFDAEQAKKQLRFGSQVVLSNTLGVLLDRFDDFWTGTFLGQTALGYYSRAYEIAQYPERVLATPVTNVFFSTYAAVQDRAQDLQNAFWQASSFLVRAGILLALLLFASTRELILILFGDIWLPVASVFQLMLIYVILDPIYVNLSYLLVGLGYPQLLNKARILQAAVFIVSVILLSHFWGIFGVAWSANLMMLTGTALLFYFSSRLVQISLNKLFAWPTFSAICAGFSVWLLRFIAHPKQPLWINLILQSVTICSVYILLLLIMERKAIRETLRFIFQKI